MGFIYENIVRPVLFKMEPEQAHERGRTALMAMGALPTLCKLVRRYNQVCEDKAIKLFGLEFPNRVGLAAGMDKDGEFPRAIEALGFGHAEVGKVTPEGQPGNPRPRLFRYPEDKAPSTGHPFWNAACIAAWDTGGSLLALTVPAKSRINNDRVGLEQLPQKLTNSLWMSSRHSIR